MRPACVLPVIAGGGGDQLHYHTESAFGVGKEHSILIYRSRSGAILCVFGR